MAAHTVTGPPEDPYKTTCLCPIGQDHTEADMEDN